MSKHPERFGQGNPEGLCASESANNATVGPALIPMLTLGIPGSPTAAVLLGGLLIHGLFPGPDLFTKHAGVTYTFLGGLLLAQFAMFALGILASRYSQYVANVPNHIMTPNRDRSGYDENCGRTDGTGPQGAGGCGRVHAGTDRRGPPGYRLGGVPR
ncbi:tripartite tricarboxylate transporter permease [uncultured Desulfovibrio sp.]|uniref:tripartite tricarboxylate transporter permease n=1 Tax=uncultured Desulfovibrio sp. TaxID=167968 RepID=UPI00260C38CC|nr:tripartite tricarboxylate transporter permease [uncultured Desulfovibrio sp.]